METRTKARTGTRRKTRHDLPIRCYRCRSCRTQLALLSDQIPMNGRVEHVQVNPAGRLCRFVTLLRCAHVSAVSEPSLEETWFGGYAWEILTCDGCNRHVGWRYRTTSGGAPPRFFALLLDEVFEDDADR
jgi:hypothetical protein